MTPNTRENASTSRWVQSPLFMPRHPKGMMSSSPAMKMRPPMVGVPDLLLCQVGPISRMDCPALRARRAGIKSFPTSRAAASAQKAARMI